MYCTMYVCGFAAGVTLLRCLLAQREKKRAMLMAEMDSLIQEKLPREPMQMITPANVPSTLYVHNNIIL